MKGIIMYPCCQMISGVSCGVRVVGCRVRVAGDSIMDFGFLGTLCPLMQN